MADTKSNKIRIFESAVEKVGRILSKKMNIRVVFQHDRCETSGTTIYLPTLPNNASKDLMEACHGHLDHEAAHVKYTDFRSLQRVKGYAKTMTVLNALEDPRIEKLWIGLYPGARYNLRKSQEWALKKVAEVRELVDPEDGQKKMMRSWDLLTDLGKFLHASIVYTTNNFDDNHWFIKDVVDPDIFQDVKKYSDYFKRALELDNTNKLVPLAKELLEKLGQEDPKQEEPEEIDESQVPPGTQTQRGRGQGQSQQSSAMTKQGPGSDSGGGPDSIESRQGKKADPEEQKAWEEQAAKAGNGSNSPGQSRYDVTDDEVKQDQKLLDKNDQIREAAKQELIKEDLYLVYTTEGDKIERVKDGDRVEYKTFMLEATKIVAPMKLKMSRSMLATAQSSWEGDKTRGKLDPRRIHQVATGTSKRVFRQRVESEDFDTCVLMMVDHSGSMHGHKLDLAAKTAIIFGELLNQLNIPFSVLGFSTGGGNSSYTRRSKASAQEHRLYARWDDLWIGEYKSFEDSWGNAGPKMINMVNNGMNNTYDGESLKYGCNVLLNRPEKRKIFFWMNDGQPYPVGGDNYAAHTKYAKDCAKEVEKLVELFAIGINTNAVKDYYSNCVQVNSIEDLPKTCLAELDALIRKGKSYSKKK